MKQVDEPITSEPRLANLPVRMRQDVVSVYRDCRCKVMKAVDEIETACRMPVQHKHLLRGKGRRMHLGVRLAGRGGLGVECDR